MSDEKLRYTVKFTDEVYKKRLAALAKEFKISQGEVIEVMLDAYSGGSIEKDLRLKREAKLAGRTSIRAMIQRAKKKKDQADVEQPA